MDADYRDASLAGCAELVREMRTEAARDRDRYGLESSARLAETLATELEQIAVLGMGRLVTVEEAVWYGVPRAALERGMRRGTIRVYGSVEGRRVRWRDAEALLPRGFWASPAANETPAASFARATDIACYDLQHGGFDPCSLARMAEVIEPLRELLEAWHEEADTLRLLREDTLAARVDHYRRRVELQLLLLEGMSGGGC